MRKSQIGIITTLTMVFGGIFLLVLGGLFSFIMLQNKLSVQNVAFEQSLQLAEAGIEYYKWRLTHFPEDLTDGTGGPGPYEHTYVDDKGKIAGKFSLTITGQNYCGIVGAVTIKSTGWTDSFPNVKRTIQAKYVLPSVAEFAFLLNSNVWAGPDRKINGPYHSNGGIRMDGENTSTVTSAKETWTCTESFGCNPPQDQQGVFTTANGNVELFSYPVAPFDFNGITVDLAFLKDIAQPQPDGQGLGLYFPPVLNGYYLKFNRTSVDVSEITDLNSVYTYNSEEGWHWEDSLIAATSFLGSYTIPQGCGVIFVEDDVWVEGEIEGKMTLVAADLIDSGKKASAWLLGNIEYLDNSGSNGLVLLSQNDVSITLDSPDLMKLKGIFIAQTGRFGRNHYSCSDYPLDCIKSSLEIFGSIVSDGRVGTKWSYSWGGVASGYLVRENIYDIKQSSSPPPFLPSISSDLELKDWEEIQ